MIDRFEKFTSVISGITHNLHRIMSEEMERYGLRGPYAVYLIAIKKHSEGVTAAQLSELCEKNKAAVSRAIVELEDIGLIHREKKSYRAIITLTEEGEKAANYVSERAKIAVDFAGSGLSKEQRETFYSALELISANLKKFGKQEE